MFMLQGSRERHSMIVFVLASHSTMKASRYVSSSSIKIHLLIHIQAMRFPMNQHRLELKNAQEAREREREMAKEIQDGDLDDEDLGGEFEGM